MNFVFDKLHLSPGAELYIFNSDSSMIYGPVTEEENIEKGTFLTDLISGDEVTIQLSEPANNKKESDLRISRVVHAYKNLFISDAGIAATSAVYNCYNSILLYPEWANESDAVALVIINNGTSLCTGSLLNNTAQDYKPYFLTAFHCIDTSPFDGSISEAEQSVAENWAFRFQYKTVDASTYITYNQAFFRAAWQSSDFALMELRQRITNNNITFLGWNKAETVNGQASCVHHPGGDFMKISFANNSPTPNTDSIPWKSDSNGNPIIVSPANTHWTVNFTNGGAEEGSSGASLFDSNKRVIGQLHGGSGNGGCPPLIVHFGRFYNSWSGGGTQETQLSYWLDPLKTGAMTTNTVRNPSINATSSIICPYDNGSFSLVGNVDNKPVTWSCSSNFTLVSASGNNAIFKANATTPQVGTILASFSGTTVSKNVYIINNPSPTSQNSVNASTNINYTIVPPQTPDIKTYHWVVQQPTGAVFGATTGLTFDVRFTQIGTYQIFAYGVSNCAESVNPTHIYIYIVTSPSGSYSSTASTYAVITYPNPATNAVTVEIKDNVVASADNAQTNLASVKQNKVNDFKISLYDEHGKLVHHATAKKGNKTHFNVAHIKNGIYYLNIYDESSGKTEKQQIVVKH